jgi:hypothetical protein
MKVRRTKLSSPEKIVPERVAPMPVCFRLRPSDVAELQTLAERAACGPATLIRAIVEEYVRQHGSGRASR